MTLRQTRRGLLRALGGTALVGSTSQAASADAPAGTYDQPSFDAGRSGFGPGVSAPTRDATVAWSRDLGGTVSRSVAVVDGVVYGSASGEAFALDAADGSTRWRTDVDAYGRGGPTVSDGTVYDAQGDVVYAVDAATGSVGWRTALDGDVTLAPVVGEGVMVVPLRSGEIVALDAADGSERWRFDTGDENRSAPALAHGTVYVGTGRWDAPEGTVYALDAATGSVEWSFSAVGGGDGGGAYSPAVHGNTVYVGINYHLFALGASDGRKRWSVTEFGGSYGRTSPAVAYGTVFGATDGGTLVAANRGSGRLRWDRWMEGGLYDPDGAPVVADRTLFLTASKGFRRPVDSVVAAYDVRTGRRRWRTFFDGPLRCTPAVADGRVFVGSTSGRLYALAEP